MPDPYSAEGLRLAGLRVAEAARDRLRALDGDADQAEIEMCRALADLGLIVSTMGVELIEIAEREVKAMERQSDILTRVYAELRALHTHLQDKEQP